MTKIHIEGIVGWDITAADVRRQLAEADGPVELLIHSPGGSVYEGLAVYNAIRDHRRAGGSVTATVTGLAASMATYIAMSADEIAVEDNAVFMVHNPWTVALGDHREMRKTADILDSLAGVLSRSYSAKTGRDTRSEMDDETYLYGQEIVDAGYADRVIPAGDGAEDRAEALAVARNAFSAMTAKLREADASQIDQIAALLPPAKEKSMSKTLKAADTDAPQTDPVEPEQAPQTDETETADIDAKVQAALAADRARAAEIRKLCALHRLPQLADELNDAGASVEQARERILGALAEKGGAEIRQPSAAERQPVDVAAAQRKLFNQVAGRQE